MDQEEKKILRGILFRHLDGIAVGPTVSAMHKGGISAYILKYPHFSFQDLSSKFETNAGYLNVALRLLASQGWLQREILKDGEEIDFKLTDKGRTALALAHHYNLFCQYIPTLIKIDHYLFDSGVQEKIFSSLIIKLKKPLKLDKDLFIDFGLIPFLCNEEIKSLMIFSSTSEISSTCILLQYIIKVSKSLL